MKVNLGINSPFENLSNDIVYFNIVQIYKELFLKEYSHFFLFELEQLLQHSIGVLFGENNDLKCCRLLLLPSCIFY